jgi:hypothetical protein
MGGMLENTPGYGGSLPGGGMGPQAGPMVYWGSGSSTGPSPNVYSGRDTLKMGTNVGTKTRSFDTLDGLESGRGPGMLMDLDDRSSLRKQMIQLGIISPKTDLRSGTIDQVWGAALQFSASAYAKGKKLTPYDILRMMRGGGSGGSGGGYGGGAVAFSGTKTTTSRDVVLTDKKTARQMIESVLQDQLGRDPNDDEYDAFVANLHREEKANPTLTTTATTYKAGTAVSSSSTRKGGLDAAGKQEVLEDELEESPRMKAERAAQRKARYVSIIEQLNGDVQL